MHTVEIQFKYVSDDVSAFGKKRKKMLMANWAVRQIPHTRASNTGARKPQRNKCIIEKSAHSNRASNFVCNIMKREGNLRNTNE